MSNGYSTVTVKTPLVTATKISFAATLKRTTKLTIQARKPADFLFERLGQRKCVHWGERPTYGYTQRSLDY